MRQAGAIIGTIIGAYAMVYVVVPLLIFAAFYVYMFYPMLFPPKRVGPDLTVQERTEHLRTKIVDYVDAHPEFGEMSLQDLRRHNALSDDDLNQIDLLPYRYHAISAQSTDQAVVFAQPPNDRWDGHRTIFHKGHGQQSWYLNWSDKKNKNYSFLKPSDTTEGLKLERKLKNNRTGNVIFAYQSSGVTKSQWNKAGTAIAVLETKNKAFHDFTVLIPDGDNVVCHQPTTTINLAAYLPPEFPDRDRKFDRQQVSDFLWCQKTDELPARLAIRWQGEWQCKDARRAEGVTKFEVRSLYLTFDDGEPRVIQPVRFKYSQPPTKHQAKSNQMTRIEREQYQRRNLTRDQRRQLLNLQRKHRSLGVQAQRKLVADFIEKCARATDAEESVKQD